LPSARYGLKCSVSIPDIFAIEEGHEQEEWGGQRELEFILIYISKKKQRKKEILDRLQPRDKQLQRGGC